MLGGRAAEQVVFNVISTGASDDIKRASEMARRMVTEFGMSEKLGVVRYATQQYQFLESSDTSANASPETLKLIDEEVQRITAEQYERAQQMLKEHRVALEILSQQLLKTETVEGEAVKQALVSEKANTNEPVAE
jgi:cell division protease FtsH